VRETKDIPKPCRSGGFFLHVYVSIKLISWYRKRMTVVTLSKEHWDTMTVELMLQMAAK
jgi:hypothetical protein